MAEPRPIPVKVTLDTADLFAQVEDLTEAERLGMIVAGAYGTALAERDQAVTHLRALVAVIAPTSWAATNVAEEAARAWLEEFDHPKAVGSPETPEQETTGP